MAARPNDKMAMIDHIEDHSSHIMKPTLDITDPELQEKDLVGVEGKSDDASTKKLIRKIDLRLIPALAFLYALALVDRANLPNVSYRVNILLMLLLTVLKARLAGMDRDLGLSIGNRYSILTMMVSAVPRPLDLFPKLI
jgi:hypothetical protein